jgi:hypothetical protein
MSIYQMPFEKDRGRAFVDEEAEQDCENVDFILAVVAWFYKKKKRCEARSEWLVDVIMEGKNTCHVHVGHFEQLNSDGCNSWDESYAPTDFVACLYFECSIFPSAYWSIWEAFISLRQLRTRSSTKEHVTVAVDFEEEASDMRSLNSAFVLGKVPT